MAKLGDGLKFKYEPIWEQAPIDMNFHYWETQSDGTRVLKIHEEGFKLVNSIEELREFAIQSEGKMIGFDTETTGLTYGEDKIVGFSLSLDDMSGIYVPIRHQEKLEIQTEVDKKDKNGKIKLSKSGVPLKEIKVTHNLKESEANLVPKEALDLLYEILLKASRVLMHNAEFDLSMIKFEGYDITKIKFFDTLILPYLFDPEATALAGLKALEKRVLGRTVPEFNDVVGKKESFALTAPKDGYIYACIDSAGVLGIYNKMYPEVRKLLKRFKNPPVFNNIPYDVMSKDNQMVMMFVDYYGHAKILIDKQKAIRYREQLEAERERVVAEIYAYFDKGLFNLSTSSKEFKEVMASKNVFTGVLTEKGASSWGKKSAEEMKRSLNKLKECLRNWRIYSFLDGKLDKKGDGFQLAQILLTYGVYKFKMKNTVNNVAFKGINGEKMDAKLFWLTVKRVYEEESEKLRILGLIHKNNSLNKALNSYVDKLTQVDECRMKYRLKGTKSGRLSSGNGSKSDKKKNHYYIDLNAQNLTKPASTYYSAEKCDMNDPEGILGWKFTPLDKDYAMEHLEDLYIVEGQDPGITIRGCLKAPEGRYVVSLDYDAEEMRVSCLLANDEYAKTSFKNHVDPHAATAWAIWGKENYDKLKRKKAKVCLTKGNYLSTNNGLKKVELLTSQDLLVDQEGNNQPFVMVKDKDECYKIKWSSGVTETYTKNHPVKVWNGKEFIWKKVCELTENDNVVRMFTKHQVNTKVNLVDTSSLLTHTSPRNQYIFNTNSSDFAYIIGLFLSDGYVQPKERGIRICTNIESTEQVVEKIKCLGLHCSTIPRGKNNKVLEVLIHNTGFGRLVYNNFGKTKEKHIPDWVFTEWGEEELKALLAGLLDSDGFIRSGYATVSSTLPTLIEDMLKLCFCLGIQTKTRTYKSKYKGNYVEYQEVQMYNVPKDLPILNSNRVPHEKEFHKTSSWTISEEYTHEVSEVLRNNGYKVDADNMLKKGTNLTDNMVRKLDNCNFPIKSNFQCVKVESKECVGEQEVYVIETKTHTYCSLGVVNHNCNFCVQYGGGAHTLAQQLDVPLAEAESIIAGYERGYWETVKWKEDEVAKMYQNEGVVFTAFGRPRQFKGWINVINKNTENYDTLAEKALLEKASFRVKSAIERRVASHLVQGACGDILRLVLFRLYLRYFRKRDPHIDFLSTVHDEINYTIDKEVTTDYVRELEQIMTFDTFDKELPITTSTDIGFTYGNMFPFVWEDEATKEVLIPKRVYHA